MFVFPWQSCCLQCLARCVGDNTPDTQTEVETCELLLYSRHVAAPNVAGVSVVSTGSVVDSRFGDTLLAVGPFSNIYVDSSTNIQDQSSQIWHEHIICLVCLPTTEYFNNIYKQIYLPTYVHANLFTCQLIYLLTYLDVFYYI